MAWHGGFHSLEALTPEGKRVIFADVSMCQSAKTVHHKKGVKSLISRTISQICVLDQRLNHRSEAVVSIIWRMNFQTKCLECRRFQR